MKKKTFVLLWTGGDGVPVCRVVFVPRQLTLWAHHLVREHDRVLLHRLHLDSHGVFLHDLVMFDQSLVRLVDPVQLHNNFSS